MNDRVIEMLEEITGDLDDAIAAIRSGKPRIALAKFELVVARLKEASKELRS